MRLQRESKLIWRVQENDVTSPPGSINPGVTKWIFAGGSEKGAEKFKPSELGHAVEVRHFDFQMKERQLLPGIYIFPAVCTRQSEIYFLAPTIHHVVLLSLSFSLTHSLTLSFFFLFSPFLFF